jgi:hypothetical protein
MVKFSQFKGLTLILSKGYDIMDTMEFALEARAYGRMSKYEVVTELNNHSTTQADCLEFFNTLENIDYVDFFHWLGY